MPTYGPRFPTSQSITDVTTYNWNNPNNALTSNNLYADVFVFDDASDRLNLTAYGFNIPQTERVVGIEVGIESYTDGVDLTNDRHELKVLHEGVVLGTSQWSTDFTEATLIVGGSASLTIAGGTLNPTIVNSPTFGLGILAVGLDPGGTVFLDTAWIRIHTVSSGGRTTYLHPERVPSKHEKKKRKKKKDEEQDKLKAAPIEVSAFTLSTPVVSAPLLVETPSSLKHELEEIRKAAAEEQKRHYADTAEITRPPEYAPAFKMSVEDDEIALLLLLDDDEINVGEQDDEIADEIALLLLLDDDE